MKSWMNPTYMMGYHDSVKLDDSHLYAAISLQCKAGWPHLYDAISWQWRAGWFPSIWCDSMAMKSWMTPYIMMGWRPHYDAKSWQWNFGWLPSLWWDIMLVKIWMTPIYTMRYRCYVTPLPPPHTKYCQIRQQMLTRGGGGGGLVDKWFEGTGKNCRV
jgi:hypothetical protein